MDRRQFLTLTGAASSLVLAGCSSDDDSTPTPEGVSTVSVGSEDHDLEAAAHTITMDYATNTTAEFRPPDSAPRSPDSGNKFVILHGEVTVDSRGESEVDVYGSVFGLQADGIINEGRSVSSLPSFTQTVVPGATFDGWYAYEVPEETTDATMVAVNPGDWFAQPTAILFEQNGSLTATMPDE